MTLYAVILFTHILGAFSLFAGLALEWVAFRFFRRVTDYSQARTWSILAGIAPRLYGPALGIILLSGAYLGTKLKAWDQGWLPVSFLTLILIGAIGSLIAAPRVRAIRALDVNAAGPISSVMQLRLRSPLLLASVLMRVALVLAVVLLMTSKLTLGSSLLVIAGAIVLGSLAVVPAWNQRPDLATTA